MTIRTGGVHTHTLSRALFQRRGRSCSQTRTLDALRTPQHFYGSRSDGKVTPPSHQTLTCFAWVRRLSLALPRTDTSATCLSLSLSHLRANSRCCLAVRRYTKQTQVMSPTATSRPTQWTVRWIRAEQGLFQKWIWLMTVTTQILTCSTALCSFLRVQRFLWTILHW